MSVPGFTQKCPHSLVSGPGIWCRAPWERVAKGRRKGEGSEGCSPVREFVPWPRGSSPSWKPPALSFGLWLGLWPQWPSAFGLQPSACGLRPSAFGLWPSPSGLRQRTVLLVVSVHPPAGVRTIWPGSEPFGRGMNSSQGRARGADPQLMTTCNRFVEVHVN